MKMIIIIKKYIVPGDNVKPFQKRGDVVEREWPETTAENRIVIRMTKKGLRRKPRECTVKPRANQVILAYTYK